MNGYREFQLSADFAGLESVDEKQRQGEKVLWLHGYTLNSYSWEALWALLPGWHHIGVDLPGHGRSSAITDFENLSDVGVRLGAVCRQHDIRHIIALSFGTVIATQLAIECPDDLDSLTLAAPSLAGAPQDNEVGEAYQVLFAHFYRYGAGEDMTRLWMTNPAWRGIEQIPVLKAALAKLIDKHSWAEIKSLGMMRLMDPNQSEDQIRTIECPTLVMYGDREMAAFKACANTLDENLPQSSTIVLPDTDHLCLLQQPDIAALHLSKHLSANQRQ